MGGELGSRLTGSPENKPRVEPMQGREEEAVAEASSLISGESDQYNCRLRESSCSQFLSWGENMDLRGHAKVTHGFTLLQALQRRSQQKASSAKFCRLQRLVFRHRLDGFRV